MKRLLPLLVALLLVASPVSALTEEDWAEVTVRQVTLDVTLAVADLGTSGAVWAAPYEAIVALLDVTEDGIARVSALTVPDCMTLWRDAVLLGLRMLRASVEVVGRAAGVADDADRAAFAASGPAGYALLVETAPALLDVAVCDVTLPVEAM